MKNCLTVVVIFGKIVDLPICYLDTHSHGDVMSRMTNDIENISTTVLFIAKMEERTQEYIYMVEDEDSKPDYYKYCNSGIPFCYTGDAENGIMYFQYFYCSDNGETTVEEAVGQMMDGEETGQRIQNKTEIKEYSFEHLNCGFYVPTMSDCLPKLQERAEDSNKGVMPDVPVWDSYSDYLNGIDTIYERIKEDL